MDIDLGSVWHDWRIVDTLGKGAFGSVYKVSHEQMGHVSYAAAKMIKVPRNPSEIKHLVSTGMDARSVREHLKATAQGIANEIEVMESLKGARNVVFIEDYRLIENPTGIGWTIWIRMELLESLVTPQTLREGLGVSETVKMGIDICNALECCHERGIIHRDVKPENVLRSSFGDYKLGDFGIAKQLEDATHAVSSRKGTMMYAAPEVIRGDAYDRRVDIYSLGIMLHRFLNDMKYPLAPEPKLQASTDDYKKSFNRRMRGERLAAPAHADSHLAKIILRACEMDPNKRYATARELRDDLLEWSREHDGRTAGAHRGLPGNRVARVAVAAAFAAVVVASGMAIGGHFGGSASPRQDPARTQTGIPHANAADAPAPDEGTDNDDGESLTEVLEATAGTQAMQASQGAGQSGSSARARTTSDGLTTDSFTQTEADANPSTSTTGDAANGTGENAADGTGGDGTDGATADVKEGSGDTSTDTSGNTSEDTNDNAAPTGSDTSTTPDEQEGGGTPTDAGSGGDSGTPTGDGSSEGELGPAITAMSPLVNPSVPGTARHQ